MIGEETKICHFSRIPHCTIGKNCTFGQNVVVSSEVVLGNNVKVRNNVIIYKGVICEDEVFLGLSVVLNNVAHQDLMFFLSPFLFWFIIVPNTLRDIGFVVCKGLSYFFWSNYLLFPGFIGNIQMTEKL